MKEKYGENWWTLLCTQIHFTIYVGRTVMLVKQERLKRFALTHVPQQGVSCIQYQRVRSAVLSEIVSQINAFAQEINQQKIDQRTEK